MESRFSTWLYRVAVNYLKNYQLLQKHNVPTLGIDLRYLEQVLSKTKDHASPEQIMLYEQVQALMNQAIRHLDDDMKLAFVLRELEGLSYEGIADILQCPVGTVRSRLFRAREALSVVLRHIQDT